MALLCKSDLEVEKLLVWKTKLPLEHKPRQSSNFSLMGFEWCLRFTYNQRTLNTYHMVTLHQVIDGQAIKFASNDITKRLKKAFSVKTYLMHPKTHGSDEIGVMNQKIEYQSMWVWFAGDNKDDIFKGFPFLYDRCEVKVVCRFFDHPQSELQLKIGKENQLSMNFGKLDKSIQVSSEVPLNFQTLSSDFSDLLEKEILPDVKLECEGQTFQAHKSILAARSEVFGAMFRNKMLESETGAVKIQDINVTILQKLLKFIYSGKSEDLSEDCTADLYEAADKYNVVSLKMSCSYWMIRHLTEENCINFLQVASSHSDSDLKAAVISFIVGNPSVMKSSDWLSLSKELPLLANEVFQTFVISVVQ